LIFSRQDFNLIIRELGITSRLRFLREREIQITELHIT